MRTIVTMAVAAGLTLVLDIPRAAAQGDFQWRGQLASGQAIEIKGVNRCVTQFYRGDGENA